MSELLKGKPVADAILARTREGAAAFYEKKGRSPKAAIIRVGARPDDLAYERGIKNRAAQADVEIDVEELAEDVSREELLRTIKRRNEDAAIDGILLFLPLPDHLDEQEAVNAISPQKDLDGVSDASKLGVYTDSGIGNPPCTAQAVMEILAYYKVPLSGKKAVVIGRSQVVGKPLAMLLLKQNATVTICHSKTHDLSQETRQADILISAAGRIGMVTGTDVREGQTVIDVGINFDSAGKMKGDVLYEEVADKVACLTPVPGGVGSVTTAVLLSHLLH
jgi:methylenetetrahydrofolate dehydrogenase (NADP+)/methenyltetrahydrofolate cyclohydrolase